MDERKSKILEIVRQKGAVVPSDVSKDINADLIVSSAILSEMVSDKILQMSFLKVGGSPLYFLPEQKSTLENFIKYLPQRERQVFELLKKKSFLEDDKIGYAEKVAMRNIKDFAIPIKATYEGKDSIFWYFYSANKQEILDRIKALLEKKIKPKEKKPVLEAKKETIESKEKKEIAEKKAEKEEKPRTKRKVSGKAIAFKEKVREYMKKNNVNMLEEKEIKNNEAVLIVSVRSDIGQLQYLAVAKNKKSISDTDLILAHHEGQKENLPVLFLTEGKLSDKAKRYAESLKGQLIFRQID